MTIIWNSGPYAALDQAVGWAAYNWISVPDTAVSNPRVLYATVSFPIESVESAAFALEPGFTSGMTIEAQVEPGL